MNKFHVERQVDNKDVSVEFANEVIEEVMMGIKSIANMNGREYYYSGGRLIGENGSAD